MDFTISESHRLLAQTVRQFVHRELLPIEMQVEQEDRIPDVIMARMAEMGFFGLPFPEEYGGGGTGDLGYILAMEQLAEANGAYCNLIAAHTSIGGMPILMFGTEEQRQRFLVPMSAGEKIGAFSLTEPNAGSDAAALETTAVQQGDRWVLNGTKIFVTNGPIADVVTLFAANDRDRRARGGITAFLVEKGMPGFRVGRIDQKMGLRGSQTAELVLTDCEVPAENVLGPVGDGFHIAMQTLVAGRICMAAQALGAAQRMLDLCVAHARERHQFGRPIGSNQGVQWMLADMATEIHAARMMTYHAAWTRDQGQDARNVSSMAKYYATEMVGRAADHAIQIFGGMGYMKECPAERVFRDVRVMRIYEGTSEIQRAIIARELLREG